MLLFLVLLHFFKLPFLIKGKILLRNIDQNVSLVIQETKEIPDLYFSNQTRFNLKRINGIEVFNPQQKIVFFPFVNSTYYCKIKLKITTMSPKDHFALPAFIVCTAHIHQCALLKDQCALLKYGCQCSLLRGQCAILQNQHFLDICQCALLRGPCRLLTYRCALLN